MDRAGLGKLHDTIPLVAGTAERAILFPAPDLHQRVQRLDTGCIQEWDGTEWVNLLCAGEGGGGEFVQAEYVVISLSDDLTSERRLQVGASLTLVDGGANGDVTLSVTCPNYCGTGSPEGVVTAAIGSWYLQRDAASTTHPLWAKRTGAGNTGWVAYAGHRGTGTQSIAIGDSSVASATNAQSFGQSASASAADTLAVGQSAAASAVDAVAIGHSATASGTSAIALGKSTTASGTRSEAIGEGSTASGTDSKAFGVGATAAAATSIAIGALATVNTGATSGIAIGPAATVTASATGGIAIGDGNAQAPNDIVVGTSATVGQVLAHPNVVIGKSATIGTTADDASPTPSARGGHVVIGENASAGMGPSAYPNTVIGRDASSVGRAVVAVGQGAQARAADTPVSGQSEGRFAVVVGYNTKASGGCVVAVGDQADVRGDNTAALGTHARANDNNTAAVGPNAFAGSVSSTGTGSYASAYGVSAQATGGLSGAYGSSTSAKATGSLALGTNAFVDALLAGAVAMGYGATVNAPGSLMIGGSLDDGFPPITRVHFNGSATPALLIDPISGLVEITPGGSTAGRTFPLAGSVTLGDTDRVAFINSTAASRTVTLPASGSVNASRFYYIRKETAANTVTIVPDGAETISGGANYVLSAQWEYVLLSNDGGDWNVEASS